MNRTILLSIICLVGCDIRTEPGTGTESGNPPVIEKPTIGTPSLKALPSIGKPDSPSGEIAPCENDDECKESYEENEVIELFEEWGQPWDSYRTYESSYCGLSDRDSDGVFYFGVEDGETSCLCVDENQNSDDLTGDRGDLLTPLVRSDCLVKGRFNNCIFYKDEFTGCDLDNATESCESICKNLEERNRLDAEWDAHIEPRLVKCLQDPKYGAKSCHDFVEIDGDCYAFSGVLFGNVNNPLDCSLTDEELLNEVKDDLTGRESNTDLPVTDEAAVEEFDGPWA